MNKARMLLAVGAVGVIVAGGSAYTASIDLGADHVVGYGSQNITGATASNVAYTLSADGTTIDQVVVTLGTDVTGETAVGDLDGTAGSCSISTVTVTCAFSGVSTASAAAFNLAIS